MGDTADVNKKCTVAGLKKKTVTFYNLYWWS